MTSATETVAYFSILQWVPNIARDERHNLGVIYVNQNTGFANMRSISVHDVNPTMPSGFMDTVIQMIKAKVQEPDFSVLALANLHHAWERSLQITEPKPTAFSKGDESTLEALFATYVKV